MLDILKAAGRDTNLSPVTHANRLWSGRRNEFAKETNVNNKNNFIHKCLWIRKKVVSLQRNSKD